MLTQKFLLIHQVEGGQGLEQPPVRPAFFVDALELVIARLAEQLADGNMHQVLLFFFTVYFFTFAQLLYADQKKNGVQLWPFAQKLKEFLEHLIPFGVEFVFRFCQRRMLELSLKINI
jgi:hypothetical protein